MEVEKIGATIRGVAVWSTGRSGIDVDAEVEGPGAGRGIDVEAPGMRAGAEVGKSKARADAGMRIDFVESEVDRGLGVQPVWLDTEGALTDEAVGGPE